jgi:LysR family transcriptional activator of nhaA
MRDLNYNHLRYFWAVAHEGSLTRAAERMNLSQSALSVQIQKLEHQLGHPLFERVGKKLILTEAGQIALDYADTAFKAGDELVSTLRGRPVASRQVLRVGALTTLSRNFQLEFLRPLVGRSDVELIVRSGNMRDLLAQLETHALDVVLANSAAPRDARSLLRNHLLNEQPVSLVGHPRPDKRKFRFPEDLRTEPVLLPSLDSDIRVAFDRVLELAGFRPIILAEVDDMAMLRLLAREREGVTLVPPIVVRDELAAGVLTEYCRIPEVSERFFAIVQKRRFPNRLLVELLAEPGLDRRAIL